MSSFLTFMFTYRFIRAVAYRWTTRWLCGYIRWENRQPLPACVYHSVRKKNNTQQHRGYANVQDGKEHWTLVNVLHWSMKKKFVIKKCSRFSFICMGHVILYILQKIVIKTMRKQTWITNCESLYLPLFFLWQWDGLLLLRVRLEVDWLLLGWLLPSACCEVCSDSIG